jgi:hypothetical protein
MGPERADRIGGIVILCRKLLEEKKVNVQRRRGLLIAAAMLIAAPATLCAQSAATVERDGVHATVRTLGYEQAASFFIGRGMAAAQVERYARPCVVLVILHNQAAKAGVSMHLRDWRVRPAGGETGGKAQPIRGRGDWLAELDREGIAPAARIGFEMVQLPEEIDMNAGDSIQGMLSVPAGRGSAFDLVVRWKTGEEGHEVSFDAIRCD